MVVLRCGRGAGTGTGVGGTGTGTGTVASGAIRGLLNRTVAGSARFGGARMETGTGTSAGTDAAGRFARPRGGTMVHGCSAATGGVGAGVSGIATTGTRVPVSLALA